jgi:hypothetical protein
MRSRSKLQSKNHVMSMTYVGTGPITYDQENVMKPITKLSNLALLTDTRSRAMWIID